jgi:cation:H+ antiporter
LAILGVTSLIAGGGMQINPNSLVLDIPFMLFVAILCFPVFRSKFTISRLEGLCFFMLYFGYTVYLIQSSH